MLGDFLVLALESEALDVFRLARHLERTMWIDPEELARHGRPEIVDRLRAKFASEHVDLAYVATLDERLEPLPAHWYRRGCLLLDCAEALNMHVAAAIRQVDLAACRKLASAALELASPREVRDLVSASKK